MYRIYSCVPHSDRAVTVAFKAYLTSMSAELLLDIGQMMSQILMHVVSFIKRQIPICWTVDSLQKSTVALVARVLRR